MCGHVGRTLTLKRLLGLTFDLKLVESLCALAWVLRWTHGRWEMWWRVTLCAFLIPAPKPAGADALGVGRKGTVAKEKSWVQRSDRNMTLRFQKTARFMA